MKQRRNEPCACGSGKKYKSCCLGKNAQAPDPHKGLFNRLQPIPRSSDYIEGMARSSRLARKTLLLMRDMLAPGITTNQLNDEAHKFITKHAAVPAPLNYRGFPKSICTSKNEVICHGIPDDIPLEDGDIVNVDITCILGGYHGDTSATFEVGTGCSEEAKKIIHVSAQSLRRAIAAIEPYGYLGDIGNAIERYAHSQGCSVVEDFVGHGIGQNFHEDPQVRHFGRAKTGPRLLPGMFFTVEPMINLGVKGVRICDDGWTAVTTDGKLSAQFEHTLLITEHGVRVLTAETDDMPLLHTRA